jgi:hypothetical protein
MVVILLNNGMAIKLSNKQHFLSILKKVKNYRGTPENTKNIFKKYLMNLCAKIIAPTKCLEILPFNNFRLMFSNF